MPLPLLVWGGIASASAIAAGAAGLYNYWNKTENYEAWKKTVPAPAPGPAPAAPQTAQQARTWNPDQAAAAQAAKFEEWKQNAMANYATPKENETALYVALALGGVAAFLLMKD